MKLLVLGCNGMAGHTVSLYLKEQGHDVFGFDRTKSKYINSVDGDAKDTDFLRKLVNEGKFDVIINCIGILNQFAENNKALATLLNSYLPHFLADITSDTKTQVIHISTDCVFSGKRGGYTESDYRDSESFYGRSKGLGELEDGKNLTIRNSIVGPDLNPEGIGLFNWFMKQQGPINGYTNAIWTGQTTLQLAKTIEAAAKQKAHGLYNMVPDHPISKYELLQLFNRYFRNNRITIMPSENVVDNKSLKRTKYDFDYLIPDYEIMVSELADWVMKHKNMYPHYKL